MTPLRTRLAASTAIAALLVALAGPLLAGVPSHGMCAARTHDCGKTTRLTRCCCGEPTDASPGPLQAKFNVSQSTAAVGTALDAVAPFVAAMAFRACNASVGPQPRDLTARFAPLLI